MYLAVNGFHLKYLTYLLLSASTVSASIRQSSCIHLKYFAFADLLICVRVHDKGAHASNVWLSYLQIFTVFVWHVNLGANICGRNPRYPTENEHNKNIKSSPSCGGGIPYFWNFKFVRVCSLVDRYFCNVYKDRCAIVFP